MLPADLLIAAGQVVLTTCALLMLLRRTTYVHPMLSLLTAQSLALVAAGLFWLSAPMSGAVVLVCGAAWLGIFTIRGRNPNLFR